MTAPGGDSAENLRGNANEPWAGPSAPVPEQAGRSYPAGFEGVPPASDYPGSDFPGSDYPPAGYPAPGYPPPGYPPSLGFPPPGTGGYPPPPPGFPPPGTGGYPPPPPGFPPPGAGGYPPAGYPPPGFGTPPGYPPSSYGTPYPGNYLHPGQAQKTNVLAIGSLVLALLGLVLWPLGVAAVVLGVAALSQIKTTGEAGHGLAVAGASVGGVAVVLAFILAMVAMN
ncbi:DUF4190 domain-containing protein [Mycolicibacter minnesotensis]